MSVYKKLMEQTLLERPSKAAQRAKAQGLKYASFGRWEDPGTGKVVAKTKGSGDAAVLQKVTPADDDKPEPKKEKPKRDYKKNPHKWRNPESKQKYKNAKQKITKDFPGGQNPPDVNDGKLYPNGKKDKDYIKDKKAYEAPYTQGKYKTMKDREYAKSEATKGGRRQPPHGDTALYPKGMNDPEYKRDQKKWEDNQEPSSTWNRPDGSVVAKAPNGDVQGLAVTDDNPEVVYKAQEYSKTGKWITDDEAKKMYDDNQNKLVANFEKWKATQGDEKDKSHMGGNFLAKLFGVQVPSLKDLISRS
tara:strand:+ start:630 stop:1538 length:909 start_codon:yes stop_codon:yes gene_type:complete